MGVLKGHSYSSYRTALGLGLLLVAVAFAGPARAQDASDDALLAKSLTDESFGNDSAEEGNSAVVPQTDAEIRDGYTLNAAEPSQIPAFAAPKLPSLTGYGYAVVRQKIGKTGGAKIVIGSLLNEPGFRPLTSNASVGLAEFSRRQGNGVRAIYVDSGVATLKDLAQSVPAEDFAETQPGVFIARLPILVRHGAVLELTGSVKELRLSTERGAVLVVEGQVNAVDSAIIGWSEAAAAPAKLAEPATFRPFIVCWGGAQFNAARMRFANLGYPATKAYGLTFSHYSDVQLQARIWPRPMAAVTESTIEGLWYGVYAWKADKLVINANKIRNNQIYGVNIHDRSTGVILANNEVTGTRVKYGIFVANDVVGSWIFGNKVSGNKRSGIVLDRRSQKAVVSGNVSAKNGADGIVVSESTDVLVWDNVLSGNQNHGIRLRNSTGARIQDNVSLANGLTGLYGAVVDTRTARNRGTVAATGSKRLEMTVVGGAYTSNGAGPFGLDYPTRVAYYNVDLRTPQRALGFRLGGTLLPLQITFLDILMAQSKVAVLQAKK
ncbi:MAG: poly(beta-D-mannuronate) C5 epimerase [Xanthomonadaceae bacterium]|nr:poly(beta-D-mannuronate) C5 epimerase [Xanthomonadaceae bacterium]